MIHLAREIVLYGLAMAVALATDVGLLVVLVELGGVPYLIAASIGFIAGGFVAYALCVRYIFSHRKLEDRRLEAVSFVSLGLVGLVVNAGVMAAGVEWLGLHYLVAKGGAAGASFLINYVLRRVLLFGNPLPTAGRSMRS